MQCWSLLADDEDAVSSAQVFPPMSRFRNFDRVALLCSRPALESAHCWRLYHDIMQRQTASAARRIHLVAVSLDDCLADDDDALRQYLREVPAAGLRPRRDGRGGYRRDVPGIMAALTAEPAAASGPVDETESDGVN